MQQKYDLYKSLADKYKKRQKYFQNYLAYAKKIKIRAQETLTDVRILVFGSIIKGNYSPNSDIDILIISEQAPEKSFDQTKIKHEILKEFEDPPFEIHLVSPRQYENWYKNFIKEDFIEI
jgi:predicted nucleotidyltransferase